MKKNVFPKSKELGGVVAMLVTPFDKQGKVDYGALRAERDWCAEKGASGIVVVPSIGEFAGLSEQELADCFAACLDNLSKYPHLYMIAMTSAPYTHQVLEHAKLAKSMGYDAQQLIPPYYWVPDEEEVYQHYLMAAGTGLPVVVYHNPRLSKVEMKRGFIGKLASIPGVVALKETKTALDVDIEPLFEILKGRIKIFTTFRIFAAGLMWGSDGGFIHPFALPFCIKMWELFQKKDYERLIGIQKTLNAVFPRGSEGNLRHIGATKAFASLVTGIPMGSPRAPYQLPPAEHLDMKKVKMQLDKLNDLIKD